MHIVLSRRMQPLQSGWVPAKPGLPIAAPGLAGPGPATYANPNHQCGYTMADDSGSRHQRNVLSGLLQACCTDPVTGFFRDGYCRTDEHDHGRHVVCAVMSTEFLIFSQTRGNDLMTPRPEYDFPGLKPGDRWCVCVLRWKEAYEAGMAPAVVLASTHESALHHVDRAVLLAHGATI